MKKQRIRRMLAVTLSAVICASTAACSSGSTAETSVSASAAGTKSSTTASDKKSSRAATTDAEKEAIESALDISNNEDLTWAYDESSDSWTSSITSAVRNPELKDYQGVSVNVPGAYVTGIDTDRDGKADVTSDSASGEEKGTLIVNHSGKISNSNGQNYTADTAPVIINTGAAGYSAAENTKASTSNAAYGYINVACGNRGKQSTATDSDGNTYYTGDAPLCLVDQKNAIRFVKYNILLGNLPGNVDYFVSTGGSGGGAHATMAAATGNNSDYFDYEAEAGAVGCYVNEDGTYSTTVSINGKQTELSDGVWGCVAYSAITSLQEADMAMAFEYYLDKDYSFNTSFQKKLASYLSKEYMNYINKKNLKVSESAVGFDLNGDGDQKDTVKLTIKYNKKKYKSTNGYGGTYLTLYLKEFQQNLNWYLNNLDYADGWTWFDEDGNALSDKEVAAMTTKDKAKAFIEGRYAKSESTSAGPGNAPGGDGKMPTGTPATGNGEKPTGNPPTGNGNTTDNADTKTDNKDTVTSGMGSEVGTPDAGTTQSASGSADSSNYSSFSAMLKAYESDIKSIQTGDKYGNNIVDLYDPLNYIGSSDTDAPTWTRIMMGASEGDMSLFSSLNLQIAWLNSGTDAEIEWQWDGGHVPSEIFGESLSLYIDEMYGKYVSGAATVTKAAATKQTTNGTATKATGTDISSWVTYKNGKAKFSLASAAAYRVKGASKAIPGFDVIDYGQETYEFGNSTQDARHFDKYILKVLKKYKKTLRKLFNKSSTK